MGADNNGAFHYLPPPDHAIVQAAEHLDEPSVQYRLRNNVASTRAAADAQRQQREADLTAEQRRRMSETGQG